MDEKMKEELDDFQNWNYLVELLSARVKELENEKLYWNCPTHGEYQNAWGCPECTVELRKRVKELEDEIKDIINYSSNYSSNYSAFGRLAEIRDKLKKLIEKERVCIQIE